MSVAHPAGIDVAARLVGHDGPLCQCVTRHRPRPNEEEIHHIIPQGQPFHGPDVAANKITLCPTTHSSVHALIRLLLKAKTTGIRPTKAQLVHYSPYIRQLADRAMDAHP